MKVECSKCNIMLDHKKYGIITVKNKIYLRKICKSCRTKENKKYYQNKKSKSNIV